MHKVLSSTLSTEKMEEGRKEGGKELLELKKKRRGEKGEEDFASRRVPRSWRKAGETPESAD